MRPQLPENILVTLLRQCYATPRCRSAIKRLPLYPCTGIRSKRTSAKHLQQHGMGPEKDESTVQNSRPSIPEDDFLRTQSICPSPTSPNSTHPPGRTSPRNVAVLGGGITGLASAYYLSKELPNTSITLYEASNKLGGWLRSKHIDVGNGKVVFEQGPRTLRPHGPAAVYMLELIKQLGLEGEVLITSKDSVASKNRFIYYPDHLVQMPGEGQGFFEMLLRVLTEPVFRGFVSGAFMELSRPQRSPDLNDESIGSFLQRRLGNTHIADNILSAVLHGIYAGDVYQLSMKCLLPNIWYQEGRYGSLTMGIKRTEFDKEFTTELRDAMVLAYFSKRRSDIAIGHEVQLASVYSFKQGIGAISDTLVATLKANSRVRLNTSDAVKRISFDAKTDSLKISTTLNQTPKSYDQVISTIPGRTLASLTDNVSDLTSLSNIHAVTVMVVNLYYTNPSLLPVHGFGYLIPRSVPWNQNPERALGVVFDSDACVGQDTTPGTKVTVMLGGHWWDDWGSYPDEDEGAAMAKAILKRHLNIEEEPAAVHVGLQRECIPQYTVGHEERMKKAHYELMSAYKGKLAVAGSSYTGVSLNDCVRSAKELVGSPSSAVSIQNQGVEGVTGLERFAKEKKWVTKSVLKTVAPYR